MALKIIGKYPRIARAQETDLIQRCGVLIGFRGKSVLHVEKTILTPNRSKEPTKSFMIKMEDVPPEVRPKIVGLFFSHLKGQSMYPTGAEHALLSKHREMIGIIHYPHRNALYAFNYHGLLTTWFRHNGKWHRVDAPPF